MRKCSRTDNKSPESLLGFSLSLNLTFLLLFFLQKNFFCPWRFSACHNHLFTHSLISHDVLESRLRALNVNMKLQCFFYISEPPWCLLSFYKEPHSGSKQLALMWAMCATNNNNNNKLTGKPVALLTIVSWCSTIQIPFRHMGPHQYKICPLWLKHICFPVNRLKKAQFGQHWYVAFHT